MSKKNDRHDAKCNLIQKHNVILKINNVQKNNRHDVKKLLSTQP